MDHDDDDREPAVWRARAKLFDGIEASRLIVRQSRVLLELAQSDATPGEYDLIDNYARSRAGGLSSAIGNN